jgi:adenylate cyclase class 2
MEVEVKSKVKNFPTLRRKLKAMGAKFGSVLNQTDRLFYPREAIKTKAQKSGDYLLRIRNEDGKHFLAYKGLTERKGVWVEYEFGIDNPQEARKLIEAMGFGLALILKKKRIPGKLGKIVFCLDQIKGLGDFIEMEIITGKGKSKEAQQKIMQIFSQLGIDKGDFVRIGYPQIILKRKGWRFTGEK